MNKYIELIRWLSTPFVPVMAFLLAALSSGLLADKLGFWHEPVMGFVSAFVVVISAYLTAPDGKDWISLVAFLIGAVVAWFLVGDSFYPENYFRAYEPTYVPLVATYIGGLIGVILCFVLNRKIIQNKRIQAGNSISTRSN